MARAHNTVVFEDYSLTKQRTYSDGIEWVMRRYRKYLDGSSTTQEVATFLDERLAKESYAAQPLRAEAI